VSLHNTFKYVLYFLPQIQFKQFPLVTLRHHTLLVQWWLPQLLGASFSASDTCFSNRVDTLRYVHLHIYGEVTSETSYPSDSHVFIFNRPCYLCIMTTLYSTSTLTRVESCNPVYTPLLKTFSIVFAHFIVFCIHLLKIKTCYSKMTTLYGVKHYISLILCWRGFTMTHTHTHHIR